MKGMVVESLGANHSVLAFLGVGLDRFGRSQSETITDGRRVNM
jgi:hypothetical protein